MKARCPMLGSMAFRRLNSLSAATYRHVLPRRGVNHVPAGYGEVVLVTRFRDLQLLTPPGVFAPRSDALMLIDAASGRLHGDVLDVCAGSGVLGLPAARAARSVTAVDVSRLAVWTARETARLNRRRVETRRGDLFAPVAGRRFDIIL